MGLLNARPRDTPGNRGPPVKPWLSRSGLGHKQIPERLAINQAAPLNGKANPIGSNVFSGTKNRRGGEATHPTRYRILR